MAATTIPVDVVVVTTADSLAEAAYGSSCYYSAVEETATVSSAVTVAAIMVAATIIAVNGSSGSC